MMGICINEKHILLKNNNGIITSLFPDFCYSDEARTTLVPYIIVAFCSDVVGGTTTLYGPNGITPTGTTSTTTTTLPPPNASLDNRSDAAGETATPEATPTGTTTTTTPTPTTTSQNTSLDYNWSDAALTQKSRIYPVYGNEDGVGGGIISGVNKGWCRPRDNAPTVHVEGYEVLTDGCFFDMNCADPEGPANTLGIVSYNFGFSDDFVDWLKQMLESSSDSQETLRNMARWASLLNYVPPDDVMEQYHALFNSFQFQRPEKGSGRTNFDFYAVQVDKLPDNMSPQDLLLKIRYETDKLHTQGEVHFEEYSDDPYGRLVSISMTEFASISQPSRGTVLASDIISGAESGYFRFSTVYTPDDGWHPVHGTREFGYFHNRDGTYTIYTAAVDRSHGLLERSGIPFILDDAYTSGDHLWRSLQEGLSNFINEQGGSAHATKPISKRLDIDYGC